MGYAASEVPNFAGRIAQCQQLLAGEPTNMVLKTCDRVLRDLQAVSPQQSIYYGPIGPGPGSI